MHSFDCLQSKTATRKQKNYDNLCWLNAIKAKAWWRWGVSWPSSGSEFCVIWLLKRPASGWGLLWESSSFVPWLILKTFWDVSGAVPEWPWIRRFMRNSSSWASASNIWFSVLLNSCDNFLFSDPSLNYLRNLSYVVFLRSGNVWVLCQIAPRMFLSFLCLRLLVFFFFDWPFLREKRFQWLIIDCVFWRESNSRFTVSVVEIN